ncbi:Protein CBG24062 [Caenorhabditis briggsae]|uniref:Protein CBG24062 n=1 Tax=Caenorhabditis briggsae TaxID=6238 RepID=A8WJW6_CAEBR|nr:Protein CBG24062 [Caenorhabditis briggsae]CAP20759.1 Protein CBG24062 [Caenorhabditis briggsae]
MFRYGKNIIKWLQWKSRNGFMNNFTGKLMESEGLYDLYTFWFDGKRECDTNGSCNVRWLDYYTKSLDALNTSTNYHESKGTEDCFSVFYMEEAPSKTITNVYCDCVDTL